MLGSGGLPRSGAITATMHGLFFFFFNVGAEGWTKVSIANSLLMELNHLVPEKKEKRLRRQCNLGEVGKKQES